MDMNELIAHLEVKVNIYDEAKRERERYAQGVKAMAEASNKESQ